MYLEFNLILFIISPHMYVPQVLVLNLFPDVRSQLDIPADQGKTVRIDKASSAIVIIDMQK